MQGNTPQGKEFIHWFRHSSPYINAFRDRTFVIAFGGEALTDEGFASLIHDIALLDSLGIRLVLVHGARPQITSQLQSHGVDSEYQQGLRITDDRAMKSVKSIVPRVRIEIEAQLSMGVANSPMAGARIRTVSGNFVTAQPVGVRDGIDFAHTGQVRRVDHEGIHKQLEMGSIVLISPLGFSPTGELFNLEAFEVASAVAADINADKLILLTESGGLNDLSNNLIRELTIKQATELLDDCEELDEDGQRALLSALSVCNSGVRRTHILPRKEDGALLQELFSRDGIGTMVCADLYEGIRQATIEDVGGILELIIPLEQSGVLVRRSRERLEIEIDHFTVIERDGMIIGCGAIYPYKDEKVAELACIAVHEEYRDGGRGDTLLRYLLNVSRQQALTQLFILTTHTAHWFQERGFVKGDVNHLPVEKQALYNLQRNSKVFIHAL